MGLEHRYLFRLEGVDDAFMIINDNDALKAAIASYVLFEDGQLALIIGAVVVIGPHQHVINQYAMLE